MSSGQAGRITRRDLLRTAAGGVLLAPLLRARALEAQAAQPKRLILVFTPDSHPREWWPLPAAGSGFELRGPLLDFAGLEPHMLFVRQLDHAWTFDNHHEAGVAQLFTGQRFFDSATHYANGPSLDQILLRNTSIRGGTPVADIHLCVADRGGGDKRHVCCYSGPGQPIQRVWDPLRAYDLLFGGVTLGVDAGDAAAAPRRATLSRTLQIQADELRRMQAFLGAEERARLELHVESLRELELQLQAGPAQGAGAACKPVAAERVEPSDRDEGVIRAWSKQQIDLLVQAFTCDRTRVAELSFGYSGSTHPRLLGLTQDNGSWHDVVAHRSLGDATREVEVQMASGRLTVREAFTQFDRLWASQVAYLARRLSQLPEGDGSMLDNTLIYWGVESGTDHNHSPSDMQYLLIGGRNLGFATGQFLKLPAATSVHRLHTSVLHAFGDQSAQGFGIEPTCGPLPGALV